MYEYYSRYFLKHVLKYISLKKLYIFITYYPRIILINIKNKNSQSSDYNLFELESGWKFKNLWGQTIFCKSYSLSIGDDFSLQYMYI